MKVPSCRRTVTPYLTTVTRLGILEAEAGNRAESEVKQISHTAANGEVARVNKT